MGKAKRIGDHVRLAAAGELRPDDLPECELPRKRHDADVGRVGSTLQVITTSASCHISRHVYPFGTWVEPEMVRGGSCVAACSCGNIVVGLRWR